MALDPKWTATVDNGITNAAWDHYDNVIKAEVEDYNIRFGTTAGWHVDWKLGKAVLWVESGGPSNPAWKGRIMQIGNPGDPAYAELKGGKEGSALIMRPQLAADLRRGKIDDPKLNIQAGIAYLFTRMANFAEKSVEDAKDKKEYQYVVVAGDSLRVIAPKVGTTVEVLEAMNPKFKVMIHPKDVLRYRKASIQMVIVGWRHFNTANIAARYNVGDPDYAAKLDYVLNLFTKLKR